MKVLPWRKQGRPLLLGKHLYHRVQLYLKKVRDKSFSEPIQQLLKARSNDPPPPKKKEEEKTYFKHGFQFS